MKSNVHTFMSHNKVSNRTQPREINQSSEKGQKETVCKTDLSELVLAPLSAQIDHLRFELLEKIQELNESADMTARQIRRGMDE
jgi:hypothetical protein